MLTGIELGEGLNGGETGKRGGTWGGAEWCSTCKIARPMRSKHCAWSGRCVDTYDHYCTVVFKCVGSGNHRMFVLFLACGLVAVALVYRIAWQDMSRLVVDVELDDQGWQALLGVYAEGH